MAVAGVLATQLQSAAARAYALWVDASDVIKEAATAPRYGVAIESIRLRVNAAGGVSGMSFVVDDPQKLINVTDGQFIRFQDLTTSAPLFIGWVERYRMTPDFGGQGRTIAVDAVGPESLLDWAVTTVALTFRSASLTSMIQSIIANSTGIIEIRALVDPVNDQGSQARPIGKMGGAAITATETNVIDVESGTAPWVAGVIGGYANAATLAAVAGDAPPGGGLNSVSMVADGSVTTQMVNLPLPGTFTGGVPYSISFWTKLGSGSGFMQAVVGSSATTSDRAVLDLGNPALGSGAWTRQTVSWTPTSNRADAVLALMTTDAYAITLRMDTVSYLSGGAVTIPVGTTVREAIQAAAAACVTPTFLGVNVTVDQTLGLRAWSMLTTPVPPSDATTPITVDAGGTNKPTDLRYDVDAAGIVRAVLVIGQAGTALALVGDGSGRSGRVAVLTDTNLTDPVGAQARGQAYLNDYRAGLRGSLGLEDVTSGPTAAIDALRLLTLTDPTVGLSAQSYAIASLEFEFWGSKRNVQVNFGGLPPSAAALIRRLTRGTLS